VDSSYVRKKTVNFANAFATHKRFQTPSSKGGGKLLMKLRIVLTGISKALQMGIIRWTPVIFHPSFYPFLLYPCTYFVVQSIFVTPDFCIKHK
jgi:hypothetical protein